MAKILPGEPLGRFPAEVLRTFRTLKTLPDGTTVWHHLAPWEKNHPDFLLLDPDQHAMIIKVSCAPAPAQPLAQLALLPQTRSLPGSSEARILADFLLSLAADCPGIESKIAPVLLFANIRQADLVGLKLPDHHIPLVLGRESLQDMATSLSANLPEAALLPEEWENLRRHFSPEVIVPREMTVRQNPAGPAEEAFDGFLLDYDQEVALKQVITLEVEGEALQRDFRSNVITGVAGSGKTLILLYRLRLLHALYPGKRYLVLTHNRPLIRDMRWRYQYLTGKLPRNIEWATFNGWCRRHWPETKEWPSPVSIQQRADLLRTVRHQTLPASGITEGMLRSELDWIKDQVDGDPATYLEADRRGRGFRLNQEQRQKMLAAIRAYNALLDRHGKVDWADIPRQLYQWLKAGGARIVPYDAILVDEAQFFAPLWFEIIRMLLKPRSGHLLLVADPTQGFLRRGISWKSLGLEVRGKTHRLERSYRTTAEIINFASLFYRSRIDGQDGASEDSLLATSFLDLPGGRVPDLIPVNSPQDEISLVTSAVAKMIQAGVPAQHLLVLHASWRGARATIQAIERKLGRGQAGDPKDLVPGEYVRVTTINAGTGLESPIVFLMGLNALFEAEQSARISDEEREAMIQENTRKIYMAITRAGQRLFFTHVGELPEAIKKLIGH
jgi:hypothetical protein